VVASVAAAVFWFWSSSVSISNNLESFITDLQWASELNSYAAMAASIAALAAAVRFYREWS